MDAHNPEKPARLSRRDMLKYIGLAAGSSVLYQTMAALGYAAESTYKGSMRLEGAPAKGASVLVLGAGIAGMLAAYELRKAGYTVSVLEYREKAGGRCWTLRGGDSHTELGGAAQQCRFDNDGYLNPGPWRIPYHHYAILDYCRELGVAVEPFFMLNCNAYLHNPNAFGGKPQRMRHVLNDFQGGVAELLARAAQQDKLDKPFDKDDKDALLAALKSWGALDKDYRYVKGRDTSLRRGYKIDPGGGLMPEAEFSDLLPFGELLHSDLWRSLSNYMQYEYQQALFEPVGGMDMIAKGFERRVGDLIRYRCKVSKIAQNDRKVTATFTDLASGESEQVSADWCVCTIPLSILSQMEVQVSAAMKAAVDAVPYASSFKAGLQFKRRFWEEDERIFGGITFTRNPLRQISYPMHGINQGGKGVLLGAYMFGPDSYKFTGMSPEDRMAAVLRYGKEIHPQYDAEFENGISVGWSRVPWVNGCYGLWTQETRDKHYRNLCAIDGRIVLAGEHASRIPAWLEGAALSAMDAVERLHKRVIGG